MPECPDCGQAAYVSKRGLPWWTCANDECTVIAFIDDDAPALKDPRNPQTTLPPGGEST
jgi:hypothetical protein